MNCYINKIKNKCIAFYSECKNNFMKYFLKFLKIVPIIFLVSIFLLLSIMFFNFCDIQNPNEVQSQEIYICKISLSNWGTWITLVGLFFTAIWSMHQYIKSKLSKQQEKASQIATDFADNLIEKMGLISKTLLKNSYIQKVTSIFDNHPECLSQFTTFEIEDILVAENEDEDVDVFKNFKDILCSEDTQKEYQNFLNEKYSEKEQEKFNSKFPVLVESTLNHLEAICITITSQAAGSEFIYDSLHQTFLKTIKILAVLIAANNNNNVDKYFTNIIQVYNMWNKRKNKDIKKLIKTQKKINKMQKRMDNEVKKLLSKETKTV
ncbi:MAG: DUF4760 domain-containing protein [Clostridia bacterium]|nr:MAG TPA: hypothetical protein [Caudoviricetes sp.]